MDGPPGYYARTVVAGLVGLTSAVLACIAFFKARRRHDPARLWTNGLRAALPLAALGWLLYTADYAFVASEGYGYFSSSASPNEIEESTRRGKRQANLGYTGQLFGDVADVATIYVFVELGVGFTLALTRQVTTTLKALRIAVLCMVVVLFALAVALFGHGLDASHKSLERLRQYYLNDDPSFYADDSFTEANRAAQDVNHRLAAAWSVINLLISVAIIALTGTVMHKYRNIQPSRTSAEILIAAAVLNMPRWLFTTLYYLIYLTDQDLFFEFATNDAYFVCDILFSNIFRFITLVLLWVIGVRKVKGIWSTHQPWMTAVPSTMMAGQAMYAGQSGQPMVYPQPGFPQGGYIYQQPTPYGWQGESPNYQQPVYQMDAPNVPSETAGQPIYMMGSPVPPPAKVQVQSKPHML